jgi:hypothetical protein
MQAGYSEMEDWMEKYPKEILEQLRRARGPKPAAQRQVLEPAR